MRFLGPRSISSLLKTALDVVYYGLLSLIVVVVLAALALLVVPNMAAEMVRRFDLSANMSSGMEALMMLAFALSLGGYLLVTYLTRQVFCTLAEGDAFHPDNTRRLRWIGFGLAGLEILSYAGRAFMEHVLHVRLDQGYGLRAVTAWFSVLVVFVLAEVFREGARLRQEADLTI